MVSNLLPQDALPIQVGRRYRAVKTDMVVGKEDVPRRCGAVPSLGFRRRVGQNAATEDDGLRNIGQTACGQAVQTMPRLEGRHP